MEKFTIHDIVGTSKSSLITLKSTDSLKTALYTFKQHNFLSAPVIDVKTNKCLGSVDVLDCVKFAIDTYHKNNETQWKNYVMQFSFDLQPVAEVINLSTRNPFVTFTADTPLTKVIELFATGVHRCWVIDEKQNLTHVVTQSALFRFLFSDKKWPEKHKIFEPLSKKTVKELKLGQQEKRKLVTVTTDTQAIDAFKTICDNKVSAVGILSSESGKLVGNLSASDLQGFLDEELFFLGSNVLEFQRVARKKKQALLKDNEKQLRNDVEGVCRSTSTFSEMVERVIASRVHRIYIMTPELEMEGIVTLTDIFKKLHEVITKEKVVENV